MTRFGMAVRVSVARGMTMSVCVKRTGMPVTRVHAMAMKVNPMPMAVATAVMTVRNAHQQEGNISQDTNQ